MRHLLLQGRRWQSEGAQLVYHTLHSAEAIEELFLPATPSRDRKKASNLCTLQGRRTHTGKEIRFSAPLRIAEKNPEITYLFYTKGKQMVLETTDGDYRLFHRGDAVFFSGTPSWGSALDPADGYVKTN